MPNEGQKSLRLVGGSASHRPFKWGWEVVARSIHFPDLYFPLGIPDLPQILFPLFLSLFWLLFPTQPSMPTSQSTSFMGTFTHL